MPRYEITAPDGRRFEITAPEGATQEQALAYAKAQFSQQQPSADDIPQSAKVKARLATQLPNALDRPDPTAGMGAGELALAGVGRGLTEVARGAGQMLGAGPSPEAVDEQRRLDAPLLKTKAGMAGNMAGQMAPFLAGSFLPGANTLVGGGLIGAASGGLQPVGADESRVQNAVLGGLTGVGVMGATRGAARLAKPQTRPGVTLLQREGVRLTPGQAVGGMARKVEEKAKSIPLTGDAIAAAETRALEDFNRAGINRALKPLGAKMPATAEVGHRGIETAHGVVSRAYDRLLPRMKVKVDKPFMKEVGGLRQMAKSMPPERAAQFQAILKADVFDRLTPQGLGSGETAKAVQSRLGALSRQYTSSADADQRVLGQALGELRRSFSTMLSRQNPKLAPHLKSADEAYHNLLIVERAAQNTAEGVFTPNQLRVAVRATDQTLRKRATAHGAAKMQDLAKAGQQVLQSRVPDSGTASRLLMSGGVLGAGLYNPAALAIPLAGAIPYAPPVQRAIVAALTRRPDLAQPIAEAIRRAAPAATAAAVPAVLGQ